VRISDFVEQWARERPDAVAFTSASGEVTYARLWEDVLSVAGLLLELGVEKGDRVAVHARPGPSPVTVYLAVASIGAVFQGLNPAHTVDELRYVLADARPRVTFVEESVAVRRLVAELGFSAVLSLGARGTRTPAVVDAQASVHPRDAALLVYTSGSTGRPKGALLPHDALVHAASVHARRWGGEGLTTLCPFPINHVASLSDICGTALAAGGRIVFLAEFDPDAVLRAISSERVTLWGFIPAAAGLVVQSDAWASADLSSVQWAVWGGGAISSSLLASLRERGLHVGGCYGSTETVGNVCFTDGTNEHVPGILGHADHAYDVRVGPDGELLVRSPYPFLGYLGRPEASEAAFLDGWLRTGDLARQEPDGSFVLTGRAQDVFKSGGYNVYPREIELALEALPSVQAAAVVAVPDPLYGEVGHAFVVAPAADEESLRRQLRRSLAPYKVPKRIQFLGELPLLEVGKVDKVALRARSTTEFATSGPG